MKNLKILFILIVATLFIFSTVAIAIKNQSYDPINNHDTITLDFTFSAPSIEQIIIKENVYDRITIDDLPNTCVLDAPRLPVKPIKLLLPYGKTLDTIDVISQGKTVIGYSYNIEKGHNIIPLDKHTSSSARKEVDATTSHNFYSIIGTHVFRGYSILIINLFPVQYKQETGEIVCYNQMKLEIKTKKSSSNKVIRGIEKDKDTVTSIVENPSGITTYENSPITNPLETIEYIIITNEELKEASDDYTFQDLVQARIDRGISADIVTVEDIIDNPDYWVNGAWGDNNPDNPFYNGTIEGNIELFNDTQAKIRNFIRYAYTELGTEYVLLGGDADYSANDNIVPVRKLFAVEDGLPLGSRDVVEEDIPSDVYYACLDGNFNWDEDAHWGENATQNNVADTDEADLLSEVYVGRACVDAEDEVSNFVMKTLTYEETEDPYIFTGLMVGEYLGFPGVSAYGGNYKDLIIPFFPEDFDVDTLYDRDGTWSKYDLMNILNTDTPHLINHLGHGSVQYALKMYTGDISTLSNDNYFFVYSQTCLAGSFDNNNDDCAAEYFTVETPHGAFAVVMNARYGLGSEDTLESPSQVVDESFFKALFTENIRELGRANHYAKEDHIWHINENGIRWVYYETNLFGDPVLRIQPGSDPPETPEQPDGPEDGVIDEEYTFETTTTDPEEDNIYYKVDWGDNTTSDWLGAYPSGTRVQITHQWKAPGDYEIKVKAKDDNNSDETEWSEPSQIHIFQGPIIEIGRINGGLFRVNAEIQNKGELEATDVQWKIKLNGGAFIGKETSGNKSIFGGKHETVNSKMILGFGPTEVTVSAGIPESSDSRKQGGYIYLFFIHVNPGGQ